MSGWVRQRDRDRDREMSGIEWSGALPRLSCPARHRFKRCIALHTLLSDSNVKSISHQTTFIIIIIVVVSQWFFDSSLSSHPALLCQICSALYSFALLLSLNWCATVVESRKQNAEGTLTVKMDMRWNTQRLFSAHFYEERNEQPNCCSFIHSFSSLPINIISIT